MLTRSPQTNIQRIIESYELVKSDLENKRNAEWYFDTFDVVRILQGYFAYDYGTHFDKETFKASQDLYVHCFASKGWLGIIRLLPPHEEEMISKIGRFFKFPLPILPELALNELLPYLNLTRLMGAHRNRLSEVEIREYVNELRKDAGHLFKISSVLEMPTWFERYKKLIRENGVIRFEQEDFDQAVLSKYEVYHLIHNAIKEQRPDGRYEKNNHMDALALTILYEKLQKAKNDTSRPIPFFYSSHPVLKRALANIQETNPKIFSYYHHGKYYSIIREAEYFIIDQIINFERDKKPVEFFDQMTHLKKTIEQIYYNYKLKKVLISTEFKNFENEINTMVLNEFLNYVWLEQNGILKIAEGIENVIKFQENKDRVEKLFIQERDEFYKQYTKSIQVSRISTNLWKSLPDSLRRFAKENTDYINQTGFDIFLNYGLLRFGLDKPDFEPIILEKFNGIFSAIQKIGIAEQPPTPAALVNADEPPDCSAETDFLFEVNYMISELIGGVSTGKQDEHFVANLGILWMLEELDLIVQLCEMLEYKYDYYQVAFLHSGAIILSSLGRRDSVIKITEMVEEKLEKAPPHPYYNIWIGLAYIRFNMWFIQAGRPTLPEQGKSDYTADINNNYKRAIQLLKDAIAYLGSGQGADPIKNQRRSQKYFYALNNLIYYTTKGGSPDDFEAIAGYVDDFSAFEEVSNVWQNRFYDTLAWYYYRNALLHLAKKDIAIFKFYIGMAERRNNRALEHPFSRRDKGVFEKLKERIAFTKAEHADIFEEKS